MRSRREGREDRVVDGIPIVENHAGARSDDVQSDARDGDVLAAVPLEAVAVVLIAIDFDPNALVNDQIDAFKVSYEHLRDHPMASPDQTSADKTLRQAVTTRVAHGRGRAAVDGQSEDEFVKIEVVYPPGVACPIERGDRDFGGFVQEHPFQRVKESDDDVGPTRGQRPIIPMDHFPRSRDLREANESIVFGPQARRVGRHRHMQWMLAKHPPAERLDGGDPREPPADANGPDARVILRQRRVPALPGPHDET